MCTENFAAKNKKTKEELIAEAEEYLEKLEDEIKIESWWKVWMDLRSQIDVFEFRNWLSHLRYDNEEWDDENEAKTVKLYIYNNSFIQKELQTKYQYRILKTWQIYDAEVTKIEIGLKRKII